MEMTEFQASLLKNEIVLMTTKIEQNKKLLETYGTDGTPTKKTNKKKTTEDSFETEDTDLQDDTDLDDVDEELTPKKTTKPKGKPAQASFDDADEDDDLDDALGTEEPKTYTHDDFRKLLTKVVETKGKAGRTKANTILQNATGKDTPSVKDIPTKKYAIVYAQLKKLL